MYRSARGTEVAARVLAAGAEAAEDVGAIEGACPSAASACVALSAKVRPSKAAGMCILEIGRFTANILHMVARRGSNIAVYPSWIQGFNNSKQKNTIISTNKCESDATFAQ